MDWSELLGGLLYGSDDQFGFGDVARLGGIGALLYGITNPNDSQTLSNFFGGSAPKVGYQGGIPQYTANRQQLNIPHDPNRRPGSAGRRYFTDLEYAPKMARGGVASLPQGYYLGGSTDGMADEVPAAIEGRAPARLSDGEFVIPADVVSHMGNGNSSAGATALYDMMARIRKARTGNEKQGRRIDPSKFLPK